MPKPTKPRGKGVKKIRKIKVWVDVGSHGYVYSFGIGPVANRYPNLMHVFDQKMSDSLIPATLTYEWPPKKGKK